jgi:signal transduction histidine kinase
LDCEFGRISRELETAIFRVIQESLTNIHRHAESPTATIRLSQSSGKISLEIKDQGKGIAVERLSAIASTGLKSVGLRGMRERIENFKGEFAITSDRRGTCIRVAIPLSSSTEE